MSMNTNWKAALLLTPILSLGLAPGALPDAAAQGHGPGHGAGHQGHKGTGMQGDKAGSHCRMQGKMQGQGHGHGKRHGNGHGAGGKGSHGGGGHTWYGANWKTSLTPEQKAALDSLHLDYAQRKAPSKAAAKSLEVQLAVLATTEGATGETAATKIEELLALKREMLRARYAYIAAQRALLTPEQLASFDMDLIHQTMHGGKHDKKH